MIILLFILTCYGACNNMIYGSVFEGFREFLKKFGTSGYSIHKLFTCFMCLGTWMGFVISYLLFRIGHLNITPWGTYGLNDTFLIIFLNGLLSGGGVWLIHTIQEAFERAFVRKVVEEPKKDETLP